MRPIHALLGLAVVLASAASAYVATRLAYEPGPAAVEAVNIAPATAAADEAGAQRARAYEDKLAMLVARLDAVTDELETLRSSSLRAPAAAPVAPLQGDTISGSATVTEEQRRTVLAVLAEEKAREAAEAEARRTEAEQQQAERRAGRIAKELSLSPGDEARLAGLMLENTKRGREMIEAFRVEGGDREGARMQFEAFNQTRKDQYVQAFGAALAEQILQAEGDRPGFGGERMMAPAGALDRNGQGGRGRRGNAAGGAGAGGGAGAPAGGGQQQQQQ